jgi:hypothetical protein
MTSTAVYREHLRQMCDWESFLLAESRLPGSRANLALAQAAADEGDETQFLRWLTLDASAAPGNTPGEFLPFCGALGLGRLLAEGDRAVLPRLRAAAHDPRWRLRKAVAMALQQWGAADMPALVAEMADWAGGDRYEQRAAVAALCEPALVGEQRAAEQVLDIIDGITATIPGAADRREAGFDALRKALSYGWSVAIVGAPERGKLLLAKWAEAGDPTVTRMVDENLAKGRLKKMDSAWARGVFNGKERTNE